MNDIDAAIVVHVLGAGSGLPDSDRDTTSLLVGAADDWTLVDCPGSVIHKLARLGLGPGDLKRVVMTHDHVDHVYGFPHLIHAMAIAGNGRVLTIHAPRQTLATVEAMVAAHHLHGKRYPALDLRVIEMEERFVVVDGAMRLLASPATHGRDTAALRFEAGGVAVCHSSDTRLSEAVARLASDARLLFHDCGGPHRLRSGFADNHASAREAGETAAVAAAGRLVLIHLGGGEEMLKESLEEACEAFSGSVELAVDGRTYRVMDR